MNNYIRQVSDPEDYGRESEARIDPTRGKVSAIPATMASLGMAIDATARRALVLKERLDPILVPLNTGEGDSKATDVPHGKFVKELSSLTSRVRLIETILADIQGRLEL